MIKVHLPKIVGGQRSEGNGSVVSTGFRGWLSGSEREQSRGEEIANSVSHGIALVASLVGTPFLIIDATSHGNPGFVVATGLFSATMIILYLSSTLYHALPMGEAKRFSRIIEHCAIFLLWRARQPVPPLEPPPSTSTKAASGLILPRQLPLFG